jgi:hypothetical protein
MDDERFEQRLRDALRASDPGPAPRTLRDRVADVTASAQERPGRGSSLLRLARPAVAVTATAAALVIGVLTTASLRNGSPPVPASPVPAIGAPTPAPDLGAAGSGHAAPAVLIAVILVLGIASVAFVLEAAVGGGSRALVERPPRGFGWVARPRARRLLFLVLAVIVAGATIVDAGQTLLVRGSFSAALGDHLMGTLRGHGGDREVAFYRYVPGETIRFLQSVMNRGSTTLTITGGDPSRPWLELRLYPRSSGLVADGPSYPFVPIDVAPGEERLIEFAVHYLPCPGVAVPSPEPTADLSPSFVPPAGGMGEESFDPLVLRYSALGIDREVHLSLAINVVVWVPGPTMCGFDFDWAGQSPAP